MRSYSGLDDQELSRDVEAALLGKHNQRKNAGRTETIARGQVKTVLDLAGNDALSSVITITLSIDVPPTVTAVGLRERPALPPVVARIEWGCDGGSMFAEVDVVQGTTIQVPGSMAIVTARIDDEQIAPGEDWLNEVVVSACCGYWPTGRGPAQRSYRRELAESGTAVLPIPRHARAVRFLRSDPLATFQAEQLAGIAGLVIAAGDTLNPNWVMPLANGATQLRITNGDDAITVVAVFELWI